MDGPEKRREIGNIENSVAPIVVTRDTGCLMENTTKSRDRWRNSRQRC